MTLEELYYLSQISAAVASVTSLLFVGYQLRQSSEHPSALVLKVAAHSAQNLACGRFSCWLLGHFIDG